MSINQKDKAQFIMDWRFKLLGKDFNKEIFIVEKSHDYAHGITKASVVWNPIKKAYVIFFGFKANKFTLLHEVGHIYFDELTDKLEYVKDLTPKSPDELKPIENINLTPFFRICNVAEDAFVNYNLSKNREAYQIILKKFPIRPFLINNQAIQKLSFFDHLSQYIWYYLHFNFILKDKDKEKRKPARDTILNQIKEITLKKAIIERKNISEQKYRDLDSFLDNFDKIKDVRDYKKILAFEFQLLKKLNFWSKEEILNRLKTQFKITKK